MLYDLSPDWCPGRDGVLVVYVAELRSDAARVSSGFLATVDHHRHTVYNR